MAIDDAGRRSNTGQSGGPAAIPAAAAEKTVSAVFGEIVWLMSQDKAHHALRVGDLERTVMAPILLRQMRVFYDGEQPAAAVLYARVSATVAARLDAGASVSQLSLDDWQSGDELRIMLVIAPHGGGDLYAQETRTVLAAIAAPPPT